MDKVYTNFLYDNYYNLVKLYHEEKKGFENGGIVYINMTDTRIKSKKVIANFIAMELIPKEIVEQFCYDPNIKENKYVTVQCPPEDEAIGGVTDCFYLVIKTDKKEYVFNCWCDYNGKKYLYTFRHLLHGHQEQSCGWIYENTEVGKEYFKFCKQQILDNFRRSSAFCNVINSRINSPAIVEKMITEYRYTLKHLDELRKHDSIGSPEMFMHNKIGLFSPLTLKHVNTYCEIRQEFGDMDDKDIIEIGASYGGLCYISSVLAKFKSYTLVDVPEVLEFAKKFLTQHKVQNIIFLEMKDIDPKHRYDLMISDFTISELDSKTISYYLNTIKAKQAYFAMNMYESNNKKTFKKGLKMRYSRITEKPEFPKSEWPNYLLLCHY